MKIERENNMWVAVRDEDKSVIRSQSVEVNILFEILYALNKLLMTKDEQRKP